MRTLLTGECNSDNVFRLIDPTAFQENEFEVEVHTALKCLLPEYHCRVFSGAFRDESGMRRPDLALLHRSISHWFVVEVEIAAHSLDHHVLPQLRCFRFGEPDETCVSSFRRAFPEIDAHQARVIVESIPRYTLCISNLHDPEWVSALRGLEIELMTISVYEGANGKRAYELDGSLRVRKEHIAFAQYFATYSAIKVSKKVRLPVGLVQIGDQFGMVTDWMITEDVEFYWLSKSTGDVLLAHETWVQLIKDYDGRISFR